MDEELPDLEVLAEDPHLFEMEDLIQAPAATSDPVTAPQVVSRLRLYVYADFPTPLSHILFLLFYWFR